MLCTGEPAGTLAMSTTFWAPAAPTRRVRPLPDEPAYEEEQSTLPTLTIAYANLPAFLSLLGIPPESFDAGRIEPEDMDPLIHRLLWLLNDALARSRAIRAPSDDQAVRFEHDGNVTRLRRLARCCDAGLSDERIERYVRTLLDLLIQARAADYAVVWS